MKPKSFTALPLWLLPVVGLGFGLAVSAIGLVPLWLTTSSKPQPAARSAVPPIPPPPPQTEPSPEPLPPGSQRVIRTGYACVLERQNEELRNLAASGDTKAYGAALITYVQNRMCTVFGVGDVVYARDAHEYSGTVKLRRAGSPIEYEGVLLLIQDWRPPG